MTHDKVEVALAGLLSGQRESVGDACTSVGVDLRVREIVVTSRGMGGHDL